MSGFDENPFAEPTIDNPFADPAIQQVTRSVNSQIKVDDYDPFSNPISAHHPATFDPGSSQPAIMQPTQDPPTYTRSGQQTQLKPALDTAELQRRQEELERKERELSRREEEMRQNSYNSRRNNWPPLPEQCCFQPCFYQDIQVDIALEFQKIVRHLYYLWIYHGIIMLVNVVGGILLTNFKIIGLGILYVILFTPLSYLCWFRPAYKAFRSDSSFNFMVFFFIFFFQFVVTTLQTIGIPGFGTVGVVIAIEEFDGSAKGIVLGILSLIIAFGFACAAAADLFLITKIHRVYRSTGASFAKAQAEFTSEFLRNQHVRNAATNVAAAAVQSQLNSPNTNRY